MAKDLKIASGTVSEWKKGRTPINNTLKKISDYFGVTPQQLLADPSESPAISQDEAQMLEQQNIHMVPLFETVSAGFGAFAENNVIDYVPVYVAKSSEIKDTICIRVRGDSMYPLISDGDIVQVRKQDGVYSGTIAVVLLEGVEGYVKSVYYEEGKWLELRSVNPMYPPMRFEGREIDRVRIVGFVTKVIKDVNKHVSEQESKDEQKKRELFKFLDQLDAAQLEQFRTALGAVIDAKTKED